MPAPPQPSVESSGTRERVPLGVGLCFSALALNRWSLGWLLAEGGELAGALPNLLLVAFQAAVFCAGTALLRARGPRAAGSALSAPAWRALGALSIGLGLLGSALTAAPFRGAGRLERELALIDALFEAEELAAAALGTALGADLSAGARIAAVCVADLDGDGREDLYVATRSGRNLALIESGAGGFEERARALGLDVAGPCRAAAGADFDHDGRSELLVARDGAPLLYLDPDEGGVFRSRGAADWPPDVSSIALGDVDGDGWLDAVLGVGPSVEGADLDWRAGGMPTVRADPGGPVGTLLRGSRVGLELGWPAEPALLAGPVLQVALADWDGDGDLDLCLVLELGGLRWLENDGAGGFRRAAEGFAVDPGPAVRAVAFGDHDGDGRPDLFAARPADPGAARVLAALGRAAPEVGGALWWNARDGYRRVLGAESAALRRAAGGDRAAFVDLDGDGRLDLALAGGERAPRGAGWWRRARCGAGGQGLGDPRARAAYRERERLAPQVPAAPAPDGELLLNDGDGGGPRFERVTGMPPPDGAAALRWLAWRDCDRDGLPDALTARRGPEGDALALLSGPARTPAESHPGVLAIRLEGGPRGPAGADRWSPRGGHGAALEVSVRQRGAVRVLHRVHRAAELQGGAGGALTLVGLGGALVVERVRVRWTSGRVQEAFDVPSGTELCFFEDPRGSPTGAAAVPAPYRRVAPGTSAPGALLQIGALPTRIEGAGGARRESALSRPQ